MGVFSEIAMEQQNSMFDSSAAFEDDEAFELEEMESLPVPPVGTDTVPVSATSVSAGETALADAEEEPADEVAPAGEEKSAEEGNSAQPPAAEDEEKKRAEHEAAEAQRKAEFDAKQQAKKAAEQEQIARLEAMSDEEVIAASTQRVSTDVEKLTRRNMKDYNRNAPSVSDEVYDRLFDELKELEQETGIQMANSPTQTVGYPAVSRLEKTRHEIPLLSLDKTKSSMDLLNFMGEQQVMLMLKLDGLTVKLTYENGELLEAATRGDGDEGEIITHNTRAISGIPSHITYKERLVVTGEGFIRPSDFEELKTSLQDSSGKPYKNGRNLAAGSIRLMDAKTCQERRLVFMPFSVLEGFPHLTRKSDKLRELRALGFQPCKYLVTKQKLTLENVEAGIYQLRQYATDKDIPIDGIVVSFNDIAYAQSCGRTGHHYKDGLAYKFEDDLHESLLQYIEWTPGRTGEIAPVAVFTPVEIDGCEVSRASLHNLSFIEDLELMAGNRILVSKRNMIIPHVEENLDRGGFSMVDTIPHVCPCCGQPTRIHESSGKGENGEDRIIKTLYCDNPDCETRRLKKFVHFVSQKAMDIEGLSEATLEKFIGQGFIHSYLDIYRLDRYRAEIVRMDGFGEKSWQRLWDAIQQSRNTTFERYLISMDIPMIGNTASKVLGRVFHYDLDEFRDAVYGGYDFRQLPDFGETLHNNIHDWFCVEDNFCIWEELQTMMSIQKPAVAEHSEDRVQDNPFVGKTIVVTGKVEPYTRDGINDLIESLGAHAGSSVSKKTDYLVCGENAGSKLSKARDLGVTVLSPAEFFSMAGAE